MESRSDGGYPLQRRAPFREWSPSVHYARHQRMSTGVLTQRRLYDFELLYVSQGEAATTMRGQRHTIAAGQLIFLPSGVYHRNEVVSEPEARFLGIHFDFFDELDIQTESDMIVNEDSPQPDKFAREALSDAFPPLSSAAVYTVPLVFVQTMEQIVQEFAMRPVGYELACKALMLSLLAQLARLPRGRPDAASPHDPKLQALMTAIEAEPARPWTNRDVAGSLHLSLDHAAKLFKQASGLSPGEFVHAVRHREARRLLRETDLSVERVGESVGYGDIHYFSRVFRRHEGISPTDYRKLSRIL
ncbi:AraC family transcriptional regulator [Cohnella zeiphila]|uniref:AraC family transcriptional regulator n=1 Tax=Cohnella zeiphila TaxID=2761120 RepID=A0A7X0ST12_9BACL|nr:helix-turn-helix domain-containing protein [Cohnella zeiphila]MBB6735587.1 AraC family transcriptional regulator [Cohnella zeiphila]